MKKIFALLLIILLVLLSATTLYIFRSSRYMNMSCNELAKLKDKQLYKAALTRIEYKVNNFEDLSDGFHSLNDTEKIIYAIDYYIIEMSNGGLCQFFVNSSRIVAPYISEYLGIIGADEHKKQFDHFVAENNINLSDLSAFDVSNHSHYIDISQRYPFDQFDDTFSEAILKKLLIDYMKAHIEDF